MLAKAVHPGTSRVRSESQEIWSLKIPTNRTRKRNAKRLGLKAFIKYLLVFLSNFTGIFLVQRQFFQEVNAGFFFHLLVQLLSKPGLSQITSARHPTCVISNTAIHCTALQFFNFEVCRPSLQTLLCTDAAFIKLHLLNTLKITVYCRWLNRATFKTSLNEFHLKKISNLLSG